MRAAMGLDPLKIVEQPAVEALGFERVLHGRHVDRHSEIEYSPPSDGVDSWQMSARPSRRTARVI